jgi:hypothetical protein
MLSHLVNVFYKFKIDITPDKDLGPQSVQQLF